MVSNRYRELIMHLWFNSSPDILIVVHPRITLSCYCCAASVSHPTRPLPIKQPRAEKRGWLAVKQGQTSESKLNWNATPRIKYCLGFFRALCLPEEMTRVCRYRVGVISALLRGESPILRQPKGSAARQLNHSYNWKLIKDYSMSSRPTVFVHRRRSFWLFQRSIEDWKMFFYGEGTKETDCKVIRTFNFKTVIWFISGEIEFNWRFLLQVFTAI